MSVWEISELQMLPHTVQCKINELVVFYRFSLADFIGWIYQIGGVKVFHLGIKLCFAFLFLTYKASLLPLIVQGGPSDWLAEKIILTSQQYFSPSLAQSRQKTNGCIIKKRNTDFTKVWYV